MAGASNYNANKYHSKITFSEEKKKQFQQEYLKEFNEELRAKNWVSNTSILLFYKRLRERY
jgi:hypothetical protein